MPPEVLAPPAPNATATPAPGNQQPLPSKADDLLKRVTQAQPDLSGATAPAPTDLPTLNSSDIEKIQDPFAKKVVQDLYSHLQRGFQKKFDQLAEERKKLDVDRQGSNTWNRDRIQEALRNPNFVSAAQELLREQQTLQAPTSFEGTQDEWSALSESDKRAFFALESKVNVLLSNQDRMAVEQADREIKARFSDYDTSKVDQFQQDILGGKISQGAIRELIWKSQNFDRYLAQAYKFGQEDRQGTLQEKLAGSTVTVGSTIQTGDERPARQEGETPQAWFKRLSEWNLKREKVRRGQQVTQAN